MLDRGRDYYLIRFLHLFDSQLAHIRLALGHLISQLLLLTTELSSMFNSFLS